MNLNLSDERFVGEFSLAEGHTLLAIDKGKTRCYGEYCLLIYLIEKKSVI